MKVFNPCKSAKKQYFPHLEQAGPESIRLVMVDEEGNSHPEGMLLTMYDDGSISLAYGVSKDFGFALDARGKVIVKGTL